MCDMCAAARQPDGAYTATPPTADAGGASLTDAEAVAAVERLAPEQYDRLNAAVDDDLPRTAVGVVALAIVNEHLRASTAQDEGHEACHEEANRLAEQRNAALRHGGQMPKPDDDHTSDGRCKYPATCCTAQDEGAGEVERLRAAVEALADEWERSNFAIAWRAADRLRAVLEHAPNTTSTCGAEV